MVMDREALKARLLEIAKRESIKFGKDVSKEMKENIKLEKNEAEKWVKIIYIGKEIKRKPISREGFEQLLSQIVSGGKLPEFEIINGENHVKFQFQDKDIVIKVYNHYNSFFFGNLQQQTVNSFLTKYITELLDEGCATGECGCHSHGDACGVPSDDVAKNPE